MWLWLVYIFIYGVKIIKHACGKMVFLGVPWNPMQLSVKEPEKETFCVSIHCPFSTITKNHTVEPFSSIAKRFSSLEVEKHFFQISWQFPASSVIWNFGVENWISSCYRI